MRRGEHTRLLDVGNKLLCRHHVRKWLVLVYECYHAAKSAVLYNPAAGDSDG